MDTKDLQLKFAQWRLRPGVMARELFGVTPEPWQDAVFEVFPTERGRRIAMPAAKGSGKTWAEAVLGWNYLLTRPDPIVTASSTDERNLRSNLWTEMIRLYDRAPLLQALFDIAAEKISSKQRPGTWYMQARTWSKSADPLQQAQTFSGIHPDYGLFLLDESGDYPDAVMISAEAMMATGKEQHIVQGGNTWKRGGPLFRACTVERSKWFVAHITGDPDDPKRCKLIDIDYARNFIATWGRDSPWTKVAIFAEFPESDIDTLIGPEEIADAEKRSYREHDIAYSPRVLGIDVAREGNDASAMFPRQGLVAFAPKVWHNIDGIQGGGMVSRKIQEWDVDATFIDATGGYGASWIDNLRLLGHSPIGVKFSQRANDERQFFNKRAEMYWLACDWIRQGGQLPPGAPELGQALTQITYSHRNDRLILEDKAQFKERTGMSPDLADAFCFCAGTMVRTPSGERSIESLAVGDSVLTPWGHSKIAIKWTSQAERLTTVQFSHGRGLTGRPEHEIFVWGIGKRRLDAISLANDNIEVFGRWRRLLWKIRHCSLSGKEKSSGFKALVDTTNPIVVGLASKGSCIAVSGVTWLAIFRQSMKSITAMVTGPIMTSPTWNFLRLVTTNGSIESAAITTTVSRQANWRALVQPSGIVPKKAVTGIVGMAGGHGQDAPLLHEYASAAERRSALSGREHGFARRLALKLSATIGISRTLGIVHGAATSLWQTVIGRRRVALVNAQTVSVPQTLVYNLTLEEDNAYYANGVLVFNCLTFAQPIGARRPERAMSRAARFKAEYNPYAIKDSEILTGEMPR